jgi:putative hemin transport protein
MNHAATPSPLTDAGYSAADIAERWSALQREEPKLRIRDAADRLGVTEVQLLATRCGNGVTRLAADWGELIQNLEPLGEAMALTRNAVAVNERVGRYRNVEIFRAHTHMGQVLDDGIDLRLFLGKWKSGFAVVEQTPRGERVSLQFFDARGNAVHKAFFREEGLRPAFDALVARYVAVHQLPVEAVEPPDPPVAEIPDEDIDVAGFRAGWRALQDTHDFMALTRRFKVSRTQALRLADPEFARRVDVGAYRAALEAAAASGERIMVFVGNPGCIQIHGGRIENVKILGDWLNVLDEGFNLHVFEPGLAQAWVVRKPTVRGIVTGVEFFDAAGESVSILHAKRDDSGTPPKFWEDICHGLQ